MKNFRFDTICNITQEPQELQRLNCDCQQVCCDKLSANTVKGYKY